MTSSPPYILPIIKGETAAMNPLKDENYKFNFNIVINKCPQIKGIMSLFCGGNPLEKCLLDKRHYLGYTEYDLRCEINLGLVKLTFKVVDHSLLDDHHDIIVLDGITMENLPQRKSTSTLFLGFLPAQLDKIKYTNIQGQSREFSLYVYNTVHPYIQIKPNYSQENAYKIMMPVFKMFLQEDFYIGKALSETELDIIKQARKILQNIGKSI